MCWPSLPVQPRPPFPAAWRATGAEVRHTFTHFHLILRLEIARVIRADGPGIASLIENPSVIAASYVGRHQTFEPVTPLWRGTGDAGVAPTAAPQYRTSRSLDHPS